MFAIMGPNLTSCSDTFREKHFCQFHSCVPFPVGGQLLQKRICSLRSKFFLVRVDPFLERVCCPEKLTGTTKVVLHKNAGNNMEVYMQLLL